MCFVRESYVYGMPSWFLANLHETTNYLRRSTGVHARPMIIFGIVPVDRQRIANWCWTFGIGHSCWTTFLRPPYSELSFTSFVQFAMFSRSLSFRNRTSGKRMIFCLILTICRDSHNGINKWDHNWDTLRPNVIFLARNLGISRFSNSQRYVTMRYVTISISDRERDIGTYGNQGCARSTTFIARSEQ